MVFLDRALQLPQQKSEATYIVVLQAGARQFGLVVDAIGDSEEIVVKPLSKQLKGLGCFAGAAILGDGRVVLILDVMGVAQLAKPGQRRLPRRGRRAKTRIAQLLRGSAGSRFEERPERRFALPLSAVARLEEIPAEKVERSHGREVVQYCGEILPLLRTSELFHEPAPERDPLQVLVLREADESVGLVVDRIEDIVEQAVELRNGGQSGLSHGPAVIQERVADVLDVKQVLALAGAPAVAARRRKQVRGCVPSSASAPFS